MNGLLNHTNFGVQTPINPYIDDFESLSKVTLIKNICKDMERYCNAKQLSELNKSLINRLTEVEIIDKELRFDEDFTRENERLVNLFISTKKLEGRSPKTLDYYYNTVQKMVQFVDKPLANITTADIRAWLSFKGEKNNKTSVNNLRRNLNSFFNWLEAEEYILRSPMKRINSIKEEKKIKRPFTDLEIETLRSNIKSIRDRALFELLLSTGCRVNEVAKLNKEDINFNDREIIVFGKGAKQRYVYFDAKTELYLKKYFNNRTDENKALFVSEKKPYKRLGVNGIETVVRNLGENSGVYKVHPHKFRRTMATNCLKHGMPIEQIQVLLGHESIETTRIYAMVDTTEVKHSHAKYSRS